MRRVARHVLDRGERQDRVGTSQSQAGEIGSRNSRLLIHLGLALTRCQPSLRIFESSTGFLLPDGSVLSPEQRPGDEGPQGFVALRHKIDLYQANGASLGWLLLPQEQSLELWRGGQQPSALTRRED